MPRVESNVFPDDAAMCNTRRTAVFLNDLG